MRYIIMHKTNAHWEAGATPTPELVARVGALLGEAAKAGVLLGAEGLRPSSEGVRLRVADGAASVTNGPLRGNNELPAGFSLLRAPSLEAATAWAARLAAALRDAEIDIRPVTEAWDIGLQPKPDGLTTRRYMALLKATASTEAGESPTPEQRRDLARLLDEAPRGGLHLATESLRPSARGRRYKNTREGLRVTDGPFAESKEMIAGYIIVSASSLDDAARWVRRYADVVEAEEVDLRELEDALP